MTTVKIARTVSEFSLPDEIISIIISFAADTPKSLAEASIINKTWNVLAEQQWRAMYEQRWHDQPSSNPKEDFIYRLEEHNVWHSDSCRRVTMYGPSYPHIPKYISNSPRDEVTHISVNEHHTRVAIISTNSTSVIVFHVEKSFYKIGRVYEDYFPTDSTNRCLSSDIVANKLAVGYSVGEKHIVKILDIIYDDGYEPTHKWEYIIESTQKLISVENDGLLVVVLLQSKCYVLDYATGTLKYKIEFEEDIISALNYDENLDVITKSRTVYRYDGNGVLVYTNLLLPTGHQTESFQSDYTPLNLESYFVIFSITRSTEGTLDHVHVTIFNKRDNSYRTLPVGHFTGTVSKLLWNENLLVIVHNRYLTIFDTTGSQVLEGCHVKDVNSVSYISRSVMLLSSSAYDPLSCSKMHGTRNKQYAKLMYNFNSSGHYRYRVVGTNVYWFSWEQKACQYVMGVPGTEVDDVVWISRKYGSNTAEPGIVVEMSDQVKVKCFMDDVVVTKENVSVWSDNIHFKDSTMENYSVRSHLRSKAFKDAVKRAIEYVQERVPEEQDEEETMTEEQD